MELAQITAGQVVMLFLLIGTGIAAVKTGVLKPEGKQTLSNLLVYLVVPAMIVNSYRMEFSMEILHNLLASFGMSLLALLIGTGITLALTARRKDSRTPIFRFACIFSNAAYMGFPLISALFGSEGLLYASAYVTVFNILLWTMGYGFVSGSSDPKEVLHSLLHTPVLYAMVIGLCILPAADPGAAAHRPAAGADGQHDHTPFHGHHRHAPCRRGPGLHRAQQAGVEAGRRAHAADPRRLPGGVRAAGLPQHDRTGRSAAGVLSVGRHHLGVCGAVWPRRELCRRQRGPDHPAQHRGAAAMRTGGHSAVTFSLPAFFMACSSRRKSPFARILPVLPSFGPFVGSFANRFSFYNEILFHPCVSILNAARRSLQLFIEMQQ